MYRILEFSAGGFGVWESYFAVISSMWLSVSIHIIIIFLFSQLFRQPSVYLRACSCQDRSTELPPLLFFSFLLIIMVVVPLSAFLTMIVLSRNRSFNARKTNAPPIHLSRERKQTTPILR